MNGAKAFFDTNVLLYMHGGSDLAKQARAQEVYQRCESAGGVLLSTQIVQEFYSAGSRKLGMTRRELLTVTAALLELPLVVNGPREILSALALEERYRISFWDALVVAAAESGGAETLYTEDLNQGQRYGTVTVRNPFLGEQAEANT